ncbi:MAG: 2Fe-2S iron-sulfur cluster binding domain-containing protein [Rickettsiales bacterium]|nr:2Fe-2S iron-sulfur cluster binding domain-containing protein [Rickettsiales bacterium]
MIIYINEQAINFEEDKSKTLLHFLMENNFKIKSNCDGNGACGTCQVVLDEEHYNKLEIDDYELDILEKQINLTPTSRLACQVFMVAELDGARIILL